MTLPKLIRDHIPTIAATHGQTLTTRTATPHELPALLRAKIIEEASEAAAASPDELLEELADVLEVVEALAQAAGHTLDDLHQARARKAAARGGFTQGLVLLPEPEAQP